MRPLGKLLGQIAAALLLVFWGARGGALAQQPLWAVAAIVGVVALLNAINFLDAMDGIVAAVVPSRPPDFSRCRFSSAPTWTRRRRGP